MPQHDFMMNAFGVGDQSWTVNSGSLSFVGFNVVDSISFNTLNFVLSASSAVQKSITLSVGLYSLTGSTLSIANSASRSGTVPSGDFRGYVSIVATSATQNITPGTWWFGLLMSTSGNSAVSFYGGNLPNMANAFPGNFIQGAMTASTNALPSSAATSDLDVTGEDAMNAPVIVISA